MTTTPLKSPGARRSSRLQPDLYAKWTKSGSVIDPDKDPHHEDRQKALAQLDEALNRMDRKDYSEDNWKTILLSMKTAYTPSASPSPSPSATTSTTSTRPSTTPSIRPSTPPSTA